jgi:hypothetical protein
MAEGLAAWKVSQGVNFIAVNCLVAGQTQGKSSIE